MPLRRVPGTVTIRAPPSDLDLAGALLLLPLLCLLCIAIYAKARNPFHPAFVVIGTLGVLTIVNVLFADSVSFYPLESSGAGAVVLALTALAAGVVLANLVYPPDPVASDGTVAERLDSRATWYFAILLFLLYLVSNALYWGDVFNEIGLANLLRRPASLKGAELAGTIDANAVQYFFRTTPLVAIALVVAIIRNPGRLLPKLMLAFYLATALLQVRRDPILAMYSASLGTAVILVKEPRRLILPVSMGIGALVLVSTVLLIILSSLKISVGTLLFAYTAGNLSSFQALLDGFYPVNPQFPMENTFYFFYSLLKFADPTLSPSSVLKPNPYQPILPNTYSFLADYYLDLGVIGLVLAPLLVGIVIGLSHSLARRRPSYISLAIFGGVYACSAVSFMNNEWGWFVIIGMLAQAALLYVLFLGPLTRLSQFLRRDSSLRQPILPS